MADDKDSEPKRDLAERVDHAFFMRLVIPDRSVITFGRFEGVHELGRGSFGIVFRARDPQLGREVAVKLCKVADQAHRERLLREGQLLAKMSHPNIITVHDVGVFELEGDEHDGSPFIVMELAKGGSGKAMIAKRMRWEDCVKFYLGAARGLAAAHGKGIVHGDFKPSNVIAGEGGARVADFGLAHTLGSADEHNGGTPGYMAPEQIEGGGNSFAADQWAFCVSLWETIEGVRPFEGKSSMALLESIRAGEPCVGAPGAMPPRLRLALLRGLALESGERWPDMVALIAELEAILAQPSEPIPGARLRLPGGFLMVSLSSGVLGALFVALLLDWPSEPVQEPRGEAADLVSAEADEEEGTSEETGDEETGDDGQMVGCSLERNPFHVPSTELAEVCALIREGQLLDAEAKWRSVRRKRAPTARDERTQSTLMNIATETQIVVDTYRDYARQVASTPAADSARSISKLMSEFYDKDMAKVGSSH